MTIGVNSSWILNTFVNHVALSGISQPPSKCSIGTRTSGLSTDVTHHWAWYRQLSNPPDLDVLPWQRGMGHLLYLPHFALPTPQSLKPLQARQSSDTTCSLTSRLWPAVTNMEIISNTKPILTQTMKTVHVSTMITRLAIRFWWNKMVSSAEQKAHTATSHGLSCQSVQMEQSGFNADRNWKDSISGE